MLQLTAPQGCQSLLHHKIQVTAPTFIALPHLLGLQGFDHEEHVGVSGVLS